MTIAPRISHYQMNLETRWSEFYLNLLRDLRGQERLSFSKNAPGLEKLIDFLDGFLKFEKGSGFLLDDIEEPVSNTRIFEHFNKLLDKYEVNKEDNRELWNFSMNLLRSLKRIKNDEAKFQIPYNEWKVAYDFIGMMKHCPYLLSDSGRADYF